VFSPINISITPPYISSQEIKVATQTWDGGGIDNNISTADNWVSNAAPTDRDTIIANFDIKPYTL